MNRPTITVDPVATKLRRVGRLARRRMRIDADALRDGVHTDGTASVEIRGLGAPAAGVPASFEWEADRPIALVIVRAGLDGEDVTFHVGPATSGTASASGVGDGAGIRYVAFCYDAPVDPVSASQPRAAASALSDRLPEGPASRPFAPTFRERRSILSLILDARRRRAPSGAPA
ncbi:MAG TPA: hypothetical protein VIK65_04710 [Candidatus Limnocylindrales bacterium]|jgi:hypothetical protein